MEQRTVPGIVLIGGLLASAAGWLALPTLQTPRQAAATQVGVSVERARRLLHEFDHRMVQKSLLLDDLAGADVDVDMEDAEQLLESATDDYQERHAEHWATYQPSDYMLPDPPRNARATYGHLARQVGEGIRARDTILAENEQLLSDAMDSINVALAVQAGDVSGRSFAEASRLKGVIYYHQGCSERIRAGSLRSEAARKKQKLAALAGRAAHLRHAIDGLSNDDVDARTAELGERIAGLTDELENMKSQRRQADAQVAELSERLRSAKARAAAALAEMETIRSAGVDFEDPNGGSTFAEALLRQDRLFRQADHEVAALRFGQFPNARIERSGDLLRGRFVENGSRDNLTTEYGILHYQDRVSVLTEKSKRLANVLDQLRRDLEELGAIKSVRQSEKTRLAGELDRITQRAGELYEALTSVESEAFETEDAAIALLDKAGAAFRQAASAARSWVQGGGAVAQALSLEVKPNSAFAKRAGSGWMGADMTAEQADCDLAKAWIHHRRFAAYSRNAELLSFAAKALDLRETDPEAEKAKSSDAHDAAVAAIESAVANIKLAHRNAGKHWTFVARLAGADDLLTLLGHQAYLADAIAAYRNAINGRETQAYVQKYVKRLGELEAS
ncbi:MAG: hypothetical protein ACE5E5_13170 [Phycisphaerae bacterium]